MNPTSNRFRSCSFCVSNSGKLAFTKESQPQIAKVHQRSTKCLPKVYLMCTKGLPNVYQRSTKCVPKVYQMCTKGLLNVYQRSTKSLPNVYLSSIQCVPKFYQRSTQGLPKVYQMSTKRLSEDYLASTIDSYNHNDRMVDSDAYSCSIDVSG